jgi:hypothetical protein
VYISVGGGMPMGVGYTLDGAEHNNPQSNGNLPLPFPDALQEFQVATSGLSANNGVKSGASVNAVTKSGTNRFSGSAFEFLRDKRFNAPEHFAEFLPNGEQADDGLKRNQFGGTLGGPIVEDKLFFFGAYQGTLLRRTPTSQIAFVPNAQMLAGDFTALTSPECTGGRQVSLGAPFVGNRVDPALYSPAALNFAAKLPVTTDPCGQVQYETVQNEDVHQPITRIDYQVTNDQLIFGRYQFFKQDVPAPWEGPGDNILKTTEAGTEDTLHALALGHTQVMSAAAVNAVRFTWSKSLSHRSQNPGFFSPPDVGVKMYAYETIPGSGKASQFALSVADNFDTMAGSATERSSNHKLFGFSDDVTLVRGSHQLGFGANTRYWEFFANSTSRTGGSWDIDGSATGHALADFLLGRVSELEIGGPAVVDVNNWYLGVYAQDTWRASDRVTINAGVRWEPYFGQNVANDAVTIFNQANYDQGITSGVFLNAPPGFIYPGDPGFPGGKTGLNKQWDNIAPRLGVAWDVHGDGRLAVRSSYSVGYDFMAGEYHNINASAPPFGSRSLINDPPGRMDDPWGHLGGDPHPIFAEPNAPYIPYGAFGSMDPDINSPRMQQWNVTLEQQLGTSWGTSVSYLGSYSDRLWHTQALNPGVYLGNGPCTLETADGPVTYRNCSTNSNLNQRRVFSLADPVKSAQIGALDLNSDVGHQDYRGLKLSLRRRAADGVSINANYTLSKCEGTPTALVSATFNQISAGYTDPNNPDADAGYCDQDRTHLGTLNMGYQTPEVGDGVVRALASNWRVSGILSARSGSRLNVISGRDDAFTGISTQRPDLVSDDIYGPGKDASGSKPGEFINAYLNADAFARPTPGTNGNMTRNLPVGPAFWQVDLALSKLVPMGTQRVELRLETFNLFNTFNWGNPEVRFSRAQFGRITSQQGAPRILQFGVKYDF